jgi:hypothetical protein
MSKNITSRIAQSTAMVLTFVLVVAGCEEEMEKYDLSVEESALIKEKEPLKGKHCVVEATVHSLRDNRVLSEPDSEPVCFDTFSKSIEYATNGRVFLSEDDTPETVTDEMLNGSISDDKNVGFTGNYVVGLEFDGKKYTGRSIAISAPSNCKKHSFSINEMPSGWDNLVSSAKALSYCNHSTHWTNKKLKGTPKDCGTACDYIGDNFNNKTSSIKWKN